MSEEPNTNHTTAAYGFEPLDELIILFIWDRCYHLALVKPGGALLDYGPGSRGWTTDPKNPGSITALSFSFLPLIIA